MTSRDIEDAIVRSLFPPHRYWVIPNVIDGAGLRYEADLLVITKSLYAYEIEIKVSVADMKRDLEKRSYLKTKHADGKPQSKHIKGFYYAYPAELHDKIETLAPDYAGLIAVETRDIGNGAWYRPQFRRGPQFQKTEKYTTEQIIKIGWLMQIRYWNERRK